LIVLDASVAASWLLAEPAFVTTDILAAEPDVPILAPSHWTIEIANTLRTHVRSGRISVADFHAIMDRFDLLNISILPPVAPDEIGPLVQFALAYNLTAYDAAYVQLALHERATLATLDRTMRSAAGILNIPLLPAATP
jgi:predicted nucleic acid-binding protein